MENLKETENKEQQATKELLELIKEAKNSDLTVSEFKKKINDIEKRFGKENFDVSNKYSVYDTPEKAFAAWVHGLEKSKDKHIIKEKRFFPEVYFKYFHGSGYEEIWSLSDDKSFMKQFDPYYDLPDLQQKMYDELSKCDKGYRVCSNHERNWSQSLDSHGDSNGYVFPNEDEFMDWHLNAMKENFIQNLNLEFSDYERNAELKTRLGLRDFEPLSDEEEYEYLEEFKEKGWRLFEEDEEKLHEYRTLEYKELKDILLSEDEDLDEDQEDRLVFLAIREIAYFKDKGDREAVFSYLKDLDSIDRLSETGQKKYEEMKEEFEPSQKPKRKLK